MILNASKTKAKIFHAHLKTHSLALILCCCCSCWLWSLVTSSSSSSSFFGLFLLLPFELKLFYVCLCLISRLTCYDKSSFLISIFIYTALRVSFHCLSFSMYLVVVVVVVLMESTNKHVKQIWTANQMSCEMCVSWKHLIWFVPHFYFGLQFICWGVFEAPNKRFYFMYFFFFILFHFL